MTQANKSHSKNLTFIALMTAVLCIISPFSLPVGFSPVPITLSTLAIYLCLFILGLKKAVISVLLYLLLGFIGLPVFAGFSGGAGKLLGPTGGYLIGYIFLVCIAGLFINNKKGKWYLYLSGMVLGSMSCYLFGTIWLAFQMRLTFPEAFALGVLPYIPADFFKMIIALLLGLSLRKALTSASLMLY